jgi:hypothetical protein
MSKTIQQTVKFAGVTPGELFDLYMDAKKHAAAIGEPVTITRRAGAKFTAFRGGSIYGKNLLVVPKRLIVQSWRAKGWNASDPDSILVLVFGKNGIGAQVELTHANVPDDAFRGISDGWHSFYWKPWQAYLRTRKG